MSKLRQLEEAGSSGLKGLKGVAGFPVLKYIRNGNQDGNYYLGFKMGMMEKRMEATI